MSDQAGMIVVKGLVPDRDDTRHIRIYNVACGRQTATGFAAMKD